MAKSDHPKGTKIVHDQQTVSHLKQPINEQMTVSHLKPGGSSGQQGKPAAPSTPPASAQRNDSPKK